MQTNPAYRLNIIRQGDEYIVYDTRRRVILFRTDDRAEAHAYAQRAVTGPT